MLNRGRVSVFDKNLEVPQREPADYVHGIVKAVIASIPRWWAASGAEIFSMVIASPIEKRRDEFLEDIAWVVRETAARVDDLQPENLAQNERFISAVMYAARIAMSTHQREKLEALRNAVLNVAVSKTSEEEKHIVFLHLIDIFSVTHFEILRLFANRSIFPTTRMNELRERRGLTDPMVIDLNDRGLLNDPRPYVTRNRESTDSLTLKPWTLSPLGDDFLLFIALPERPK
jgi:hypothetical protein